MQNIVAIIVEMSWEAVLVTGVVLFLRQAFRRLPKSYTCVLWMLVLFRLLCPVTVSTGFSLMPEESLFDGMKQDRQAAAEPYVPGTGAPKQSVEEAFKAEAFGTMGEIPHMVQKTVPDEAARDGQKGIRKGFSGRANGWKEAVAFRITLLWRKWGQTLSFIWMAGAFVLTAVYLHKYIRWERTVRGYGAAASELSGGICRCALIESEDVQEPFACGIFRPAIYLPAGMEEKERSYILCHEQMHIRHRDPAVRLLWQAALILHWFNPLVWLTVSLVQKDMEMFCDESVMRRFGKSARKEYAIVLLHFSAKRSGLPFPVAFGESNTEKRVHHILKVKRPAVLASLGAIAVIVLAACTLLTNPKQEEDPSSPGAGQETKAQSTKETGEQAAEATGAQEETPDSAQTLSDREQQIQDLVAKWSLATVGRDGKTLVSLLKDPAEMEGLKTENGNYSYGWSSPWPWTDEIYVTYSVNRDKAVVFYYANTSDPNVFVWREELAFTPAEEGYVVAEHELNTDPVNSAVDFLERYSYDQGKGYEDAGTGYRFRWTPVDYFYVPQEENRLCDIGQGRLADWYLLQEEENPSAVESFKTPQEAAKRQLYLDGGRAVEVESPDEDHVCLRWEFADGQTDVIMLCRMDAGMKDREQQSKLWAVEDILTPERYREYLTLGRLIYYYEQNVQELGNLNAS